jgi:hypothetical protein
MDASEFAQRSVYLVLGNELHKRSRKAAVQRLAQGS